MTLPEEKIVDFADEKKRSLKAVQKKIASFLKALKNAHEQLERSKEFEQVQHMAELLKAHFPKLSRGMSEITVEDWKDEFKERKIDLDPLATPQEQVEEMFRKSQRLKRALSPLEALVGKLKNDFAHWQQVLSQVEAIKTLDELQGLQNTLHLFAKVIPKEKEKKKSYHTFRSQSGDEILVGKNASGNDFLTFQVANGNDLWLHAHALSGAHVVIRKKRGHEVDSNTLEDALQLALYHSKARNDLGGSHEVMLTERKYVSRLPRTPKGRVVVSKHKIYTVVLDKDHIEQIKKRH